MKSFHHLMNVRTPFDGPAQDMLVALGQDYRLSLPIEAEPAPGIVPVPQAEMIQNGIIGVYVPLEAAEMPEIWPHWPMGMTATELLGRPSIVSHDE